MLLKLPLMWDEGGVLLPFWLGLVPRISHWIRGCSGAEGNDESFFLYIQEEMEWSRFIKRWSWWRQNKWSIMTCASVQPLKHHQPLARHQHRIAIIIMIQSLQWGPRHFVSMIESKLSWDLSHSIFSFLGLMIAAHFFCCFSTELEHFQLLWMFPFFV